MNAQSDGVRQTLSNVLDSNPGRGASHALHQVTASRNEAKWNPGNRAQQEYAECFAFHHVIAVKSVKSLC